MDGDIINDGSSENSTPTLRGAEYGGSEKRAGDVTRILSAIEQGDERAAEELLPLVHDGLRKLAQENPGQTLQAATLVHEAYPWLVDVEHVRQ